MLHVHAHVHVHVHVHVTSSSGSRGTWGTTWNLLSLIILSYLYLMSQSVLSKNCANSLQTSAVR